VSSENVGSENNEVGSPTFIQLQVEDKILADLQSVKEPSPPPNNESVSNSIDLNSLQLAPTNKGFFLKEEEKKE
jgi:hypothetical protein